jgi:hypothetical protein
MKAVMPAYVDAPRAPGLPAGIDFERYSYSSWVVFGPQEVMNALPVSAGPAPPASVAPWHAAQLIA